MGLNERKVSEKDEFYMREALREAALAADDGEVPIGCVLVWEDRILVRTHNQRQQAYADGIQPDLSHTALAHAECEAIAQACKILGGWRLHKATLYVTVEPCPMCAGAILNAHIPRVVYGTKDCAAGAFGSVLNLNAYPLGWKPEIIGGILENECRGMMQTFFMRLREKREKKSSVFMQDEK